MQLRRRSPALLFMGLVGVIIAALLVVPQLTGPSAHLARA